jgi:hypothetical protein
VVGSPASTGVGCRRVAGDGGGGYRGWSAERVADRRRWWLEEGGAARRRSHHRPRVAAAGALVGGRGKGTQEERCGMTARSGARGRTVARVEEEEVGDWASPPGWGQPDWPIGAPVKNTEPYSVPPGR